VKKILFLLTMCFTLALSSAYAQDAAGYMAVKDTITNADTSSHEMTITGGKSAISFQVNVIKLTGTVAGSVKVWGSVDGSTYGTTAVSTTALTDATANYLVTFTANHYKKYKVDVITTGTSTASTRTYYLYRK
jgi:hypothetical protein